MRVCFIPDEFFADGAEGRLGEERGTELVTFDHVDFGLFDGAAPLVEGEQALSLPLRVWVGRYLTSSI